MAGKKFDSKLEEKASYELGDSWEHHPKLKLPFTVETHYEPDFIRGNTIIEAKGYHRGIKSTDITKYKLIREQHPEFEYIFAIPNTTLKFPGSKRRKDGSVQTLAEWLTRNHFAWYVVGKLDEAEEEVQEMLM